MKKRWMVRRIPIWSSKSAEVANAGWEKNLSSLCFQDETGTRIEGTMGCPTPHNVESFTAEARGVHMSGRREVYNTHSAS